MGIPNTGIVYDAAKLQTLVNAAATAANVYHAAGTTNSGTATYFDQVAGAQIGSSGRYTPDTQQTIYSVFAPVAGAGTPTLPWNTAQVISLRTARPRGRCSNGRVYWPALSGQLVATTGRMSAATLASHVTGAKTFFDALNVAAGAYQTGMRVIVASNVGIGDAAVVTSIRCDDRMDSIERRENDQPSVWSTATLA
jgi:hypothetical protein